MQDGRSPGHDRAEIQSTYVDGLGETRGASPAAVARAERALATPAGPGPVVTDPGAAAAKVARLGRGTLVTEDGDELDLDRLFSSTLPLGYHRVVLADGTERAVIVSPRRCAPAALGWGWATQLYAVRSATSWGMGDLGDLARLGRWARGVGASCLMVNPLGAVAPTPAQQASPYDAATRRFPNPLYLRVEDVPGAAAGGEAVAAAARAGRALADRPLIDRDEVWQHKRAALEAVWAAAPPPSAFERWLDGQPRSLHRFATWCALTDRHGPSWPEWPSDLRHPEDAAVHHFAAAESAAVRFHAWLQWNLELQLGAAAAAVDLVHDLPVGFSPTGFDAWEWQDVLALDMSIGAPPDAFNTEGQGWGLPPFVPGLLRAAAYGPLVDTVRSLMGTAAGLRIDHVLGLFRQWWVPEGHGPVDGVYVRFPADELLAVLALESHRHRVPIIGEDLGTVEEGVRAALAAHGVLSYRVLWFESDPPTRWPAATAAAVTTHDLPTVAGVWTGEDADHQLAAGMTPDPGALARFRRNLCRAAGLTGNEPVEDAVVAAHRLLAGAPSALVTATLEDAVAATARPNLPGTVVETNWSQALPVSLEELERHPLARRVAAALSGRAEERTAGTG
ncbi:MAG: 4-alpha-glucanotransferase [Acidimicrobiales bacterium]